MFDNHPNLAAGTILTAPTPALSGTTFTLYPGDGSAFEPNMPVTLTPPDVQPDRDNAEIGYLTAVAGEVVTIQRGQEGTAPLPVQAGWRVYGTATRKTFEDIEAAIGGKVDAVAGKGLSTNDYTSTEKTKLAGIAAGATQNASDALLRDRSTHTGTQPVSTVSGLQTALDGKQAAGSFATTAQLTSHTTDTANPHAVTKAQVGLGNVDNTSDASKPVSAAQAAADASKVSKAGDSMTGRLDFPATSFSITNPPVRFTDVNVSNDDSSKGNILEWGGMMTPGTPYAHGIEPPWMSRRVLI